MPLPRFGDQALGADNPGFYPDNGLNGGLGQMKGQRRYNTSAWTQQYVSEDSLIHTKGGHDTGGSSHHPDYNDGKQGCCSSRSDCIERPLSRLFERYGRFLARHPVPFIILPIIISAALGVGFMRINVVRDVVYLFTPTNGIAKQEGKVVLDKFPDFTEDGAYVLGRDHRWPGDAEIFITTFEEGGNLWTKAGLQAALQIDEIVTKDIEITEGNTKYNYSNMCSNFDGVCWRNPILEYYKRNSSLFDGRTRLNFPNHPLGPGQMLPLGGFLGGVTVENMTGTPVLKEAKALRLMYYLVYEPEVDKERARKWMKAFRDKLEGHDAVGFKFYWRTEDSLEEELQTATQLILPQFSITYGVLITFVILSSLMRDPVRSKPWLAALGVISAALAILSGLGLCMAAGLEFASVVAVGPFLALGIGVDDMFVLLSAWRHTDVTADVGTRMGKAMHEAAVSITITTITDALAFGVGAFSVFRSVQLFCIYTGVAILFAYAYSITFFSACIAISGRLEDRWEVCLCLTVRPRDIPEDYPEPNVKDTATQGEHKTVAQGRTTMRNVGSARGPFFTDHLFLRFFKNHFGPFLTHPIIKWQIILTWFVYIGIAGWGCSKVEQGLDLKHLANDKSYLADFYDIRDTQFNQYGPQVMVIITNPMDYSKISNRVAIEKLLQRFDDSGRFVPGMRDSWLEAFLGYLNFIRSPPPQNETAFVGQLSYFLNTMGRVYKGDVNIKDNKIQASRFLVQTINLGIDANQDKEVMLEARRLAKEADDLDLEVSVYCYLFVYFDQYTQIASSTITNLGIAFACMLVVSLFLIPHPLTSLWVALSIISIEVGLLGFMTFWHVNLDAISMINLILCIGFSVDFSAHITYAFISAHQREKRDKVITAVAVMGYPILQGGVSTILGVVILAFSQSYIFRTFFKTMFLVMVLGMWHALFVLPAALSILMPNIQLRKQTQDEGPRNGRLPYTVPFDNDVMQNGSHDRQTTVPPDDLPDESEPQMLGRYHIGPAPETEEPYRFVVLSTGKRSRRF